jgi:hypothetical protein
MVRDVLCAWRVELQLTDQGDNQRGADGREIALEPRAAEGERLHSPSVARNKEPIAEAFADLVGVEARVLEVGSGTGEHGACLTGRHQGLIWQPSDPDPASRASISAWAETVPGGRLLQPLELRTDRNDWWEDLPGAYDTGVSINMIHIAPWAATEGLFRGMAQLLDTPAALFFYGPFLRNGVSAESNHRFSADLKRRDPDWGVRDLDTEIVPLAAEHGFGMVAVREMPGNNLSVLFRRS